MPTSQDDPCYWFFDQFRGAPHDLRLRGEEYPEGRLFFRTQFSYRRFRCTRPNSYSVWSAWNQEVAATTASYNQADPALWVDDTSLGGFTPCMSLQNYASIVFDNSYLRPSRCFACYSEVTVSSATTLSYRYEERHYKFVLCYEIYDKHRDTVIESDITIAAKLYHADFAFVGSETPNLAGVSQFAIPAENPVTEATYGVTIPAGTYAAGTRHRFHGTISQLPLVTNLQAVTPVLTPIEGGGYTEYRPTLGTGSRHWTFGMHPKDGTASVPPRLYNPTVGQTSGFTPSVVGVVDGGETIAKLVMMTTADTAGPNGEYTPYVVGTAKSAT